MTGDSKWKKQSASKKANQYPTYVGDLPVKVIQDIIDSLSVGDDWKKIAGRTGLSEKQVRVLEKKNKGDEYELTRIVFDQWLCRMPKPKDLALLLLCIDRTRDVKTLLPYLNERDRADVEKRMQRRESAGPAGVDRSSRASDSITGDVPIIHQFSRPSEEESSSVPPSGYLQAPGVGQSVVSSSFVAPSSRQSVTSRSVVDSRNQLPPNNAISLSSDILSQCPPMPPRDRDPGLSQDSMFYGGRRTGEEETLHGASMEASTRSLLTYPTASNELIHGLLQIVPQFEWQEHFGLEMMPGHREIYYMFFLGQKWVVKSFLSKGPKKLFRELTFLSKFKHPQIIPLSGYIRALGNVTDQYNYLLVYPRMYHQSLQDYYQSGKRFPDMMLRLRIMKRVANALAYIHGNGFVHGDLSMANILLNKEYNPVLIDFELSRRIDEDYEDQSETIECTKPFMPISGRLGFTVQRDVHAFGVILTLVYLEQQWRDPNLQGKDLVTELFDRAIGMPNASHIHSQLRALCLDCVSSSERDNLYMTEIANKLKQIRKNRQETSQGRVNTQPSRTKFVTDD